MQEASNITVRRTDLAGAVTFASMAVSKRPNIPVLAGMVATISAGTLTVSAFDYDTYASAKVSGQATAPGSILINGRDLAAAVRALPNGKNVTATLTIGTDAMVITSEGTETILSALDMSVYPAMPAMPTVSGMIDGRTFVASVSRVAPIAGTDDTLPMLTHVHMISEHGEITMAATDRYRLAVDRFYWTGPDGAEVLIPASVLARFAKSADTSGKIALAIGENNAGLSDGTRSVIVRTYPLNDHGRTFVNYSGLTRGQDDHGTIVTADAGTLRTAVERAGKLTGRNDRMGFDVTDGRVTITAVKDGQTTGTQHVPAEVAGPDYLTGFNAGYLASVLAGFPGRVRIGFKTSTRTDPFTNKTTTSEAPAQLTADGKTFLALVMTVRPKN